MFGALELPFLLRLVGAAPSARSARLIRVLFGLFCGATILLGLVPTRQRVQLGDASFIHVMAFIVGVMSLMGVLLLWLEVSAIALALDSGPHRAVRKTDKG